jgi:hypothetical protein
MSTFYYNGRKFINGYACDGAGRPITVNNGYSSEDERDSKNAYEEAILDRLLEKEQQDPKYKTKTNLNEKMTYQQLEFFQDETPSKQNKRYSENGYLLNEMNQEISLENGYSDEDDWFSKNPKNNTRTF